MKTPLLLLDGTPVTEGLRLRLTVATSHWPVGTKLTVVDWDWASSQVVVSVGHPPVFSEENWLPIDCVEPLGLIDKIGELGG